MMTEISNRDDRSVHAALLTRSDEPAIKFIFLFIRDFYGPVEAELVKNPVSSLPGG